MTSHAEDPGVERRGGRLHFLPDPGLVTMVRLSLAGDTIYCSSVVIHTVLGGCGGSQAMIG